MFFAIGLHFRLVCMGLLGNFFCHCTLSINIKKLLGMVSTYLLIHLSWIICGKKKICVCVRVCVCPRGQHGADKGSCKMAEWWVRVTWKPCLAILLGSPLPFASAIFMGSDGASSLRGSRSHCVCGCTVVASRVGCHHMSWGSQKAVSGEVIWKEKVLMLTHICITGVWQGWICEGDRADWLENIISLLPADGCSSPVILSPSPRLHLDPRLYLKRALPSWLRKYGGRLDCWMKHTEPLFQRETNHCQRKSVTQSFPDFIALREGT